MREQLIGYLLDALEADERDQVEAQLRRDPQLQYELELLHESLEPLRADDGCFLPPVGLAERTCQLVTNQVQAEKGDSPAAKQRPAAVLSPVDAIGSHSSWSFADLAIAAGIFLAAAMLLFPAIENSRTSAQLTQCQNNLRQLGLALAQYSEHNQDFFPSIDAQGKMAVAGVYAVRLVQGGYLSGPEWLVCPSSPLADDQESVHVPSTQELSAASGKQLVVIQQQMGGSYGYSLGYVQNGVYHSLKNLHRSTFAIMADVPSSQGTRGYLSSNHGGCGQNVLFEDGHVRYRTYCTEKSHGLLDHIFLNDGGLPAAGNHDHDAVIVGSSAGPLLRSVSLDE